MGTRYIRIGVALVIGAALLLPVPSAGAGDTVLPDVMNITCVGGETEVDTTTIRPQNDGFHFNVTKAGAASAIQFWRPSGRGYGGFEFGAPPTERVYPVRPGHYLIRCISSFHNGELPEGVIRVELADADGIYHRKAPLACGRRHDRKVGASGNVASEDETREEAIVRLLVGVSESDAVEYVRFPEPPAPFFRIVRADRVIAQLYIRRYEFDDQPTWGISGEACRASGIDSP